jgi:hypothetical protein
MDSYLIKINHYFHKFSLVILIFLCFEIVFHQSKCFESFTWAIINMGFVGIIPT